MKTDILYYYCCLDTTPQALFDFHTQVENLPLITPPWISVMIVNATQEGVDLDIKRFGVKTRWEIAIEKDVQNLSIRDTMKKGPFRFFQHTRYFMPLDNNKVCMKETVELALPLGWLGRIFLPFVRWDMNRMFAFRHSATQKQFTCKEK